MEENAKGATEGVAMQAGISYTQQWKNKFTAPMSPRKHTESNRSAFFLSQCVST
jgi:hypothetical protein